MIVQRFFCFRFSTTIAPRVAHDSQKKLRAAKKRRVVKQKF
jgi:hypothetical protein